MLIYNWQQSPISSISVVPEIENANLYAYVENQTLKKYQLDGDTLMFQIQKQDSFTFLTNHTLNPYCESNYKLCGGVEYNSKYCILDIEQSTTYRNICPYNDIITQQNFTNGYLSQYKVDLQTFSRFFYDVNVTLPSNKSVMVLSTLQSKQPITNFRFGYNGKVCKDVSQFFTCDQGPLNYNPITTISASKFFQLNNINYTYNITSNDTIGLYAERYIEFDIHCRYTLIERVVESPNYYKHLGYILYIQTITTLVYCIFIGIFLNLVHFFMLSDFSFILVLPLLDQKKVKRIRRVIYGVRFLSFLPFGTIICLLYFYEAQFNDTINRIYNNNCIQKEFEYIFSDTLSHIKQFRQNQIAIFWIFIAALIVEIVASFAVVYRSANVKKKNLLELKYEHEVEIKHDEIQQFQPPQLQQKVRPTIRASFNPNEQKAIRQSIQNGEQIQRKTVHNKDVLMAIDEQQGEFEQKRDSVRPVWEPEQQPINTMQSPINGYNQQFNFNRTK